ncbi:hypothetical protein [Streptomyces albidoflavus]|uniref:hypothetical protein n=1 Tax=Streptomyces albidoflavus TaxID=1886 RepID=UPI003403BBC2
MTPKDRAQWRDANWAPAYYRDGQELAPQERVPAADPVSHRNRGRTTSSRAPRLLDDLIEHRPTGATPSLASALTQGGGQRRSGHRPRPTAGAAHADANRT